MFFGGNNFAICLCVPISVSMAPLFWVVVLRQQRLHVSSVLRYVVEKVFVALGSKIRLTPEVNVLNSCMVFGLAKRFHCEIVLVLLSSFSSMFCS